MADNSSEKTIAGFKKEAMDLIVPFIGGVIAYIVARHMANGFWETLAVIVVVYVIYSVIIALLKRAWVRPDLVVPFVGGLIASIVARHFANGIWAELAVLVGVFAIYSVIVALLKHAWRRPDLIVPFIGGLIASIVARHVANGFWEWLAVFAGIFVSYSVIAGLLQRAWVHRSPN